MIGDVPNHDEGCIASMTESKPKAINEGIGTRTRAKW